MAVQGSGKSRYAKRSGAPATPPTDLADVYLSTTERLSVKHDDGSVTDLEGGGFIASTFVPVRVFSAFPGTDATSAVQDALTNVAAGSTLAFEPGTYTVNGVDLIRDNIGLYLPPGCILKTTTSTAKALLYVNGALDTSTSKNVVQNPSVTDDLAWPRGGERTIFVTAGDETAFAVDSWLTIEDLESVPGGLSTDTGYFLEHHMEMVRVKARSSGRLDLWSPLVNSYTNVSATAPKLRTCTPVQNVRIWGGGTIQNITTPTGTNTSHGIQMRNVVGAVIEDIQFTDCFNSCVAFTRVQDARISKCLMRDPPRFDSRGYGITMYGGIRVTVSNNTMKRLRHCVDVSFFSRVVSVTGNVLAGSTTGNLHTHPCVEGVTFAGNVIDGGYGQDASSNSTEYGDVVVASGINIDENNKCITISGNVIRNMRRSGIHIDMGSTGFPTEFVTIEGNTIENCVTARRITSPPSGHSGIAGITMIGQNAAGNRGIICRNNVLREPGQYGITCDVSNAVIEGNWIYKAEDKTQTDDTPAIGIGIAIRSPGSGECNYITVRGNVITECRQHGIAIGSNAGANVTDARVEGNVCRGNLGSGIFLEEIAPFAMVRGNSCQGNADDGINSQATDGYIENNELVGNDEYGIRVIAGANNNVLKDNIFAANGSGSVNNGATGTLRIDTDPTAGYIYNNGGGNTAPFEVRAPFIFNEAGAAIDARFEGDTDVNLLCLDAVATNNPEGAVGVGTNTPQRKLHVFFQDSTTNTSVECLRIQRNTSGTAANGIGAAIGLVCELSGGGSSPIGTIEAIADNATTGSDDSSIHFTLRDNASNKEVLKLDAKQLVSKTIFTATATGTIANSTTETEISSTGVGTKTLPAAFFIAGKTVRVSARGYFSTQATPVTLQLKVKLGSTVVLDTGVQTPITTTNHGWAVEGLITCRTTGASGTVFSQGSAHLSSTAILEAAWDMENTATTTIDTTATQAVSLTAQWGAGVAAADTINCSNFVVEVLN